MMEEPNPTLEHPKFLSEDSNEPLQPLPVNKKTAQENDIALLPEIFEFEAVEDVKDGGEAFYRRKAIQKAICMLSDGGESERDVKKWQFICKVCSKAFDSVDLCEEHILKNDHTFMASEEIEDEDFDMLRIQLETLRKMNGVKSNGDEKEKLTNGVEEHKPRNYDRQYSQDFVPIYFGKWSQVICELRHRFGQACHGDCKNADFSLSETRTFPEALERTIDGVYEKLANESLVHSSCPQNPASEPQISAPDAKTLIPEASLLKYGTLPNSLKCALDELYQKSIPPNERRACPESFAIKNEDQDAMLTDHDAVAKDCKNSSTETEISELTVPSDTDQSKEKAAAAGDSRPSSTSSETANCQIQKVKVCVDFVTRLLYCESCFTTFTTIEQAFAHFKTDGDSDKSADQYTWDEYDVMHQMNRSNDKLQGLSGDVPDGGEMEMAGTNHDIQETKEKVMENFAEEGGQEEEEEEEEAQPPNENHPQEFSDTLQSPSKLDSENQNENDSLDSYSEKMPLFESSGDRGKQKRKKKKKKKAWRMIKRSVMYAIIFFF